MELRSPTAPSGTGCHRHQWRYWRADGVDLLNSMLRLQTTGSREALANGTNRQGAAMQHAKGRVAQRVNPLGVKVVP